MIMRLRVDVATIALFAPVAVTLTRVPGQGDRSDGGHGVPPPLGQNTNLLTSRSGRYPLRDFPGSVCP